jgi:hypothetical protein
MGRLQGIGADPFGRLEQDESLLALALDPVLLE